MATAQLNYFLHMLALKLTTWAVVASLKLLMRWVNFWKLIWSETALNIRVFLKVKSYYPPNLFFSISILWCRLAGITPDRIVLIKPIVSGALGTRTHGYKATIYSWWSRRAGITVVAVTSFTWASSLQSLMVSASALGKRVQQVKGTKVPSRAVMVQ